MAFLYFILALVTIEALDQPRDLEAFDGWVLKAHCGKKQIGQLVTTKKFSNFPDKDDYVLMVQRHISLLNAPKHVNTDAPALRVRVTTIRLRDNKHEQVGQIAYDVKVEYRLKATDVQIYMPEDGRCAHSKQGGPCALNDSVAPINWCDNCQHAVSRLCGSLPSQLSKGPKQ